jgi:hypothetical protein
MAIQSQPRSHYSRRNETGEGAPSLTEKRGDRMLPVILHVTNTSAARTIRPKNGVGSGLSGTSSCWRTASNCFASDKVKPKEAMSRRSSGRSISMTSVACPSPSAPVSPTSKSSSHVHSGSDHRREKYPPGAHTPNLEAVPVPRSSIPWHPHILCPGFQTKVFVRRRVRMSGDQT